MFETGHSLFTSTNLRNNCVTILFVKTADWKRLTVMLGNEMNASTGWEELFGLPCGMILERTKSGVGGDIPSLSIPEVPRCT